MHTRITSKFQPVAAGRVAPSASGPTTPRTGFVSGTPPSADIAAWDISIAPDGAGLPAGSGTAKQAAELFKEKCAVCHGLDLKGKPADALVGGQGTLTAPGAVKTVGSYWPYATTLFDFIRRAMPLNEPQSLTNDQVYALSAFILYKNGIIGETTKMDAKSLPKVKIPNHDNFFQVYPGNLKTEPVRPGS